MWGIRPPLEGAPRIPLLITWSCLLWDQHERQPQTRRQLPAPSSLSETSRSEPEDILQQPLAGKVPHHRALAPEAHQPRHVRVRLAREDGPRLAAGNRWLAMGAGRKQAPKLRSRRWARRKSPPQKKEKERSERPTHESSMTTSLQCLFPWFRRK